MKSGILFMLQKAGGFGMIAVDGGAEQVFLLHSDLPPALFDTLKQGRAIPGHWATDREGRPTTDPKAALATLVARQPMGRLGTPEEMAAGILYLASDEAGFATGSALVVDGGYCA